MAIYETIIYKANNPEYQRLLTYYLFAKEFGWTPAQVNALDYRTVLRLKKVIEIVRKEEKRLIEKGGKRG